MKKSVGVIIFCLIGLSAAAQVQITLVDKESKKNLAGVAFYLKGEESKPLGVSDLQGRFEVALETPATLITSHIGYTNREIEINTQTEVIVELEQSVTQLKDVVVTGQFEPQSVSKSVFRVRTIPLERLQAKGATRLQDVLNTELNINFRTDPALGISDMYMQGMRGQNIKVLINGVPVIGRQGTANSVDLNQINVSSIERIEIIEGPMSTIYGSDALAGVINIITKKPEGDKFSGSVKIHEENVGKEYSLFKQGIHQENISLQYKSKAFYTLADIGHYYSGGWQGDSVGREKQWHPKSQWLGGFAAGIEREKFNISYRLDYLNEDLYDPAEFLGTEALDKHYISNRFMHQLQLKQQLSEKIDFNAALAYTNYSRQTQTVTVDAATGEERLALSGQDITKYDGLTARGTLLYKISDRISMQPGYDINLESGSGGRLVEGRNKIADYAAFLSAELKPFSFLTIRPGVRFEKNSVYKAPPILPSVNTKFQLSPKHDLRLSYGRGFRAPSLRELYFHFYDASHQIDGNPNLKAEESNSYNISWNWEILNRGSLTYTSVVTGFYNHVRDLITLTVSPGSNQASYFNISKFKTQGLTLTNTFKVGSLNLIGGFSYTGQCNADINPTFTWAPEINGSVSYQFKKAGILASAYYKYSGRSPYYVADSSSPTGAYRAQTLDYHWADLSLQKTFFKKLTAVVGARNLFDVTQVSNTSNSSGTHSDGGPRSIGSGRSYFTTLTLNF